MWWTNNLMGIENCLAYILSLNLVLSSLINLDFPYYNSLQITDINTLFTNKNYRRMDSILLNNNQISYINGDLFYNYIKGRPLDVYINLANNKLTTVSCLVLFVVHALLNFYLKVHDI